MNTSSYGMSATAAAQGQQAAGVSVALSGSGRRLETLEEAVKHLTSRLEAGGVLRPSAPVGVSTGAQAVMPSSACALAGEIERGAARIGVLADTIGDVLGRLDI